MKHLSIKLSSALLLIGLIFTSNLSLAESTKLIREKSFNVKSGEKLYVDASGADVKIKSWDKEEVNVKIFGNRKAEEKMRFEIERTEDGVSVIARKRGGFSWFFNWGGYSVKIEVMVPPHFNPDIETSGGDISIADLTGRFKLETSGGDITLSQTSGQCKVTTSGGDIIFRNHDGITDASTSGGDIRAENHKGDFSCSTSGGDIFINLTNGKISASTSGGDVTINYTGESRGIKASTSGGDVNVTLPANFNANVSLETTGGEIDCNFANMRTNKVSRGTLKADFNNGGNSLICKTSGGDIKINSK